MLEEKIKIKKIKPENQKTKKTNWRIKKASKNQTDHASSNLHSVHAAQLATKETTQGPSRAIVVVVDDPLLEGAVPSKYRNGVAGFRKIYASLPISNEPLCAQWGLQGYLYKKQDETGGVWLGRT